MMTAIKIVFILLLLAPIALLMRHLLIVLSAESSGQTDSAIPVETRKSKGRKADPEGKGKGKGKGNKKSRRRHRKSTLPAEPADGGDTGSTESADQGRRKSTDKDSARDVSRSEDRNSGSGSTYVPRQPEQWQRSERVPFGEAEGYRVAKPGKRPIAENPSYRDWKKPSDAVRERTEEEAVKAKKQASQNDDPKEIAFEKGSEEKPIKKRKRSEKTPSKRQLRKNRERARKRDLKKRKQEEKSSK